MDAPPVIAVDAPPVLPPAPRKPAWRWLVMLLVLASYPLLLGGLAEWLREFGLEEPSGQQAILPSTTRALLWVCLENFGFFALLFAGAWFFARPSLDDLWARWRRPWITFGLGTAWSLGLRVLVAGLVGSVVGGMLLWQMWQGVRVTVSAGGRSAELVAFNVGTNYVFQHAWRLRGGANFSATDVRDTNRVCLLGSGAARRLFGAEADPVGRKLQLGGESFTVTGWLASPESGSAGSNPDDLLLVPSSVALASLDRFRPKVENVLNLEALRDPVYLITVVTLVSFVVAGLREELWRAGMMAALLALLPARWRNWRGQTVAITFAAVIFGLGHLPQGPAGVLLTGLLGLGLGGIMTFHRSLWIAVLAHGLFDATSFLGIWALQHYGVLKQFIPG